jgi:aryl carrier-like protein
MSYKRLNFKHPLPRKIYAHIKQTETNYSKQETVTFDVVIMDESGVELVEIEEFSEKRINDLTGQIKAMAEGVSRAINVSEVEQAGQKSFYQESLNEGISPQEGVDAFTRILAGATLPQVVVSTKDLAASIAQANAFTQERLSQEVEKLQVERPLHPRPDIKTAYVEPRNSAEQTLADIMQEMLGVERVGIHDNFFELGGDSVLSIQIIARANRVGIQITPQQIFQHQTIAELAAVAVQSEIGETLRQATRQDEAEKITRPAFELTGLNTRKLNKLTQLLDDSDGMEEEDEAEESVETGEPASAQERNGVGEFETVLRQHPAIREAVVVAHGDNASAEHGLVAYVVLNGDQGAARQTKKMEYSLFYFAADNSQSGQDKYRLYLEGAKFADRHDFAAVWTPERHFHESGGLYPSPSVLSASLATIFNCALAAS